MLRLALNLLLHLLKAQQVLASPGLGIRTRRRRRIGHGSGAERLLSWGVAVVVWAARRALLVEIRLRAGIGGPDESSAG